jgi:hypothetical protein
VEDYKMISINMSRLLCFPNLSGYADANKRLRRLVNIEKRLKIIHNDALNMSIYTDINQDLRKLPTSPHRIYLLQFYCKLVSIGAKIINFEIEKKWQESEKYPQGKFRSDGLIVYNYKDKLHFDLIEVNVSNNPLNLQRFDYVKEDILERCHGINPRMILIDDHNHKKFGSKIFETIRVDFNLNNFYEILN